MPEGDSVRLLARRLDGRLTGKRLRHSDFRVPQLATADLAGGRLTGVTAYGKHLLMRFQLPGDVPAPDAAQAFTLRSHLRMDGGWRLMRPASRLPHPVHEVRLVLEFDDVRAVGIRLHDLALVPAGQERELIGHLGPDVLAEDFDPATAADRMIGDPLRPALQALLDQRGVAGLGNLWAIETLHLSGIHPDRPAGAVSWEPVLRLAQRMMRHSLAHGARQVTTGDTRRRLSHHVYGRAGQPCRRCRTAVAFRPAAGPAPDGGYARELWWCPACQPMASARSSSAQPAGQDARRA